MRILGGFALSLLLVTLCWAGNDYETAFDNQTSATVGTTWTNNISRSERVTVHCIMGNATGVVDIDFDNDGSHRQHFRTFSSAGSFSLPVDQTWKNIFLTWRSKEKTHPFKPMICHVKTLED